MSDPINPTEPLPAPAPAPSVTPTAPVAPVKRNNGWVTPALALVAALAVGLVGGVLIGHSTATTSASSTSGFARQGGQGGFGGAGGTGGGTTGGFTRGNFTAGTITAVDGSTITIKETDGTSVTVKTSATTKVTKSAASTVDALKAGETITVVGLGTDGSGTATSITEGALRQFGARPGAAAGAGTNG